MRKSSWIILSLLLSAVGARAVHAGSIPAGNDPSIQVGGALPAPSLIDVSSPGFDNNFTFQSATGTSPGTSPCVLTGNGLSVTSPLCSFENDITQNGIGYSITEIVFFAMGPAATTTTCGGQLPGSGFTFCRVIPNPVQTTIVFSGSVPFEGDFSLSFSGFPPNQVFGADFVIAPEPASALLLVTVLGFLGWMMRKPIVQKHHPLKDLRHPL